MVFIKIVIMVIKHTAHPMVRAEIMFMQEPASSMNFDMLPFPAVLENADRADSMIFVKISTQSDGTMEYSIKIIPDIPETVFM